jgi:hypothetical protein
MLRKILYVLVILMSLAFAALAITVGATAQDHPLSIEDYCVNGSYDIVVGITNLDPSRGFVVQSARVYYPDGKTYVTVSDLENLGFFPGTHGSQTLHGFTITGRYYFRVSVLFDGTTVPVNWHMSEEVSGSCFKTPTTQPSVTATPSHTATPTLTLTPEPSITATPTDDFTVTPSATVDPSVTPTATTPDPTGTQEPSVTPVTPEPSATPETPEPTATDPAPREEPACHPNRIPAGEQWRSIAAQEPDVFVFALAGDNTILSQLFGGSPIKSLKIDFEWNIPVWELTFPNYLETRLGFRVGDAGKPGFDAIIDGCVPQELRVEQQPTPSSNGGTARCATCPPVRFCGTVPFASEYSDWFLGDLWVVVALEPFSGSQQITIDSGVAYIAHGLTEEQMWAIDVELEAPLEINDECSLPCENWGVITLRDGRKAVWVGNGTNADELGVVLRSLNPLLSEPAGEALGSKLLDNLEAYQAVNRNKTYAYFYADDLTLVEELQPADNENYIAWRAELDRRAGK